MDQIRPKNKFPSPFCLTLHAFMLSLFSVYLLERTFLRCYHKSIGKVEKKKIAKRIRFAEVNIDNSNSGNINKSHYYS